MTDYPIKIELVRLHHEVIPGLHRGVDSTHVLTLNGRDAYRVIHADPWGTPPEGSTVPTVMARGKSFQGALDNLNQVVGRFGVKVERFVLK